MRIKLKNFRCHRDLDVKIPNSGFVQLSGENRTGKSTLLAAICFALYGKLILRHKAKKTETHQSKSCAVTLYLDQLDLKITRRTKPKQLLVTYDEVEYEDSAAQSIIDKVTGMTLETFKISSYIVQLGEVSVLSRTPTEQLKLIEALTFSDDSHNIYRDRIREEVKNARTQRSELQGERNALEHRLGDLETQKVEEITVVDNVDSKKLSRRIKQKKETIKATKKQLDEYKKQLEYTVLHERRLLIKSELDSLPHVNDDLLILEKEIEDEESRLKAKKYLEELKKLKVEPESIDDELRRLRKLQSEIKSVEIEIQSYEERVKEHNEATENLRRVSRNLRSNFAECKSMTKVSEFLAYLRKISMPSVKCPKCSTLLAVDKNFEVIGTVDTPNDTDEMIQLSIQHSIKNLETESAKLKKKLGTKPQIPEISLEEVIERISALSRLKTKLSTLEKIKHREGVDLGKLKERQHQLRSKKKNHSRLSKEYKELSEELEDLAVDVDPKKTSEEIKQDLEASEIELERLNRTLLEAIQLFESSLKAERYQRYRRDLSIVTSALKRNELEIEEIDDRIEGLLGLEATSKEAEILAVEETVNSINELAKGYLSTFFTVPISVRLEIMKKAKTTKRSKLQLNTNIIYNGDKIDHIGEVCVAEYQLCDIAFMMAINDFVGSKFLLMDESLSGLAPSLQFDILGHLKSYTSEKLILIVVHGAVEGIFEHSIKLTKDDEI